MWLAKYRNFPFGEVWRRVEAVRKALFDAADKELADCAQYFGNGALRAAKALAIAPDLNLPKQPEASAAFSFLRALTGLAMTAADEQRRRMFDLEIVQLTQGSNELENIVPDPGVDRVPEETLKQFVEAVIDDKRTSRDLRLHLADMYRTRFGGAVASAPAVEVAPVPNVTPAPALPVPKPVYRCLRGFAFDPSISLQLETERINKGLFQVPWEELRPGPISEYIEVVDESAEGERLYEPVDLNHPFILAQDGLPPSQDNPQFHQQQAYAVARTTIQYFEDALGRPVLWSAPGVNQVDDSVYQGALKIYPHAMLDTNAFYSPRRTALLFGYFDATQDDPGGHYPGGRVYTCLSHDIVAHETTHAILDGLHRRFQEPTNADVLAFHEGFADIVALFQHFAMPEALDQQIGKARGDLKTAQLLSDLAIEFGQATGKRAALRSGIGPADPTAYQKTFEVHERGAILVAAVFDAFLAIYERRATPILKLATSGTGVLPAGSIPTDLAHALAVEASKTSAQVLDMCIRALDYAPPVDITFGDYLRALVTADRDFAPDDDLGYRLAFVEGFRRRALYPRSLRSLSVESLLWPELVDPVACRKLEPLIAGLRNFANDSRYCGSRKNLFELARNKRIALHDVELPDFFGNLPENEKAELGAALGLDLTKRYEIHSIRVANRIDIDGNTRPQIVLEITQSRHEFLMPDKPGPSQRPFTFRSGVTLIIDLDRTSIRYAIQKPYQDEARLNEQRNYLLNGGTAPGAAYFQSQQFRLAQEPFRLLHR